MNPTMRYTATYGLLSGLVVCAVLLAGFTFADKLNFSHQLWFGYLVILGILTFILVGVKRYRDVEHAAAITFFPALGPGLARPPAAAAA